MRGGWACWVRTVAADEGHQVEVLTLFFVGEGVGLDDFAVEARGGIGVLVGGLVL